MGICSSKEATVTVVQTIVQERPYIDYAAQVQRKANQLDDRIASLNTYILSAFDKADAILAANPDAKKPKIKILANKAVELRQSAVKSLRDFNTYFPNLDNVQDSVLQRIRNSFTQQMSLIDIMRNRIIQELTRVA